MKRTFEAWMAKVDAELIRRCGFDSQDLPDYCYSDAYEDDATPSMCAAEVLANA